MGLSEQAYLPTFPLRLLLIYHYIINVQSVVRPSVSIITPGAGSWPPFFEELGFASVT